MYGQSDMAGMTVLSGQVQWCHSLPFCFPKFDGVVRVAGSHYSFVDFEQGFYDLIQHVFIILHANKVVNSKHV